ncbi:hypothetical protein ALC62_12480 [Cyphomyrmex costatus]|uniref:Mutator-like transposase domain-containing protein n=1 Tax=Cyphomyrmex costatus TaxID=456900 RepID=A0A151IB05_9HYME|nr:hypothetical protein ALC62_12480 [Cyphomyrmex costatus]
MSDKKVYTGKKGTRTSYPTRCRSSVIKRRPLNRFEVEDGSSGVSASTKKLKVDHDDIDVKCEFGYRIINFFAVFSAISQHVKCKTCNSDIKFDETSSRGLGFKITISCSNCPRVEISSSPFIKNAYEINRRIVLTMRILGIMDKQPYNFEVKKKECIDHVQKRMGTRLRNLKKTVKNLGGKLTNKLIDQLTIYYGLAIRRNPNSLKNMKNEIWATLYHKTSTDENSQHELCSEFWCDWKKAQAANSLRDFHHKPPLPANVFEKLKPIYVDLSRNELLNRCLGGYTQNSNESFNATVWNLASKSYSSGKKVLQIATDIAVCNFNDGLTNILRIMQVLEMTIGPQSYNFCVEADAARIKHAEVSLTDAAKEARSSLKSTKKKMKRPILI